jgi:hypothetical protein
MNNQEQAKKHLDKAEQERLVARVTARATVSCAYSLLAILDELKSLNNQEVR